jgi:hypothetical protein
MAERARVAAGSLVVVLLFAGGAAVADPALTFGRGGHGA